MPRGENDDRLIGIELLRFGAAFAVLIWHYQNFVIGGFDHQVLVREAQPLHAVLAPFYTYGNAGVELFWCISGFIFTWKYLKPIHNREIAFGRFIWLRFSRLYPLHFVTLLAVAALNGVYFMRHGTYFMDYINDTKHFLLNLGFASYWGFQTGNSFNGPIWSVSVEILVYFLFFGTSLVWRGAVWGDIGIALAASACYAGLRHAGVKLEVFGAVTFFYIGVATCRVDTLMVGLASSPRRATTAMLFIVVLLTGVLVGTHVLKIAGASLIMFPAAILLAQRVIRPRSERWRLAIGAVGNLTYASYLIHFPLQIAIVLVLESTSMTAIGLFYGPWLLPAYLTLVLGLSVPVFHRFERPVQLWLRSFARQRVLAS